MSTGTELNPELVNPTLPFSEAMNGLLALTQNEQLMESMVELMVPSEFNLPNPDEFANIS